MIKTCGNCQFIIYDDDGSAPYCAIQDLYTDVDPQDRACDAWAASGEVDQKQWQELKESIRGY